MNFEMAKRAAMRGETVRRCAWVHTARVCLRGTDWRFSDTGSICIMDGIDVNARDWVIVRKRPRDVFRHPRRGDVVTHEIMCDVEILAVAPEGVLLHRAGLLVGEAGIEFASRPNRGWTVKTRAPARKS